jgi:hypothetical protein
MTKRGVDDKTRVVDRENDGFPSPYVGRDRVGGR